MILKSVRFFNKLGELVKLGEGCVFMCDGERMFLFSPEGEMMRFHEQPDGGEEEHALCWNLDTDKPAWFAERYVLLIAAALDLGLELIQADEDSCFGRRTSTERCLWRLVKLPA